MNRNSKDARAIAARTGILTRQLESWSGHGLGIDSRLPFEQQCSHYLEVQELSGPGRSHSADLVALQLAVRERPTPRLRQAILNSAHIAEVDTAALPVDHTSDESLDQAFEDYEVILEGLTTTMEGFPPLLRRVFEKLRDNANKWASETGESGEEVFHSALVNLLHVGSGGALYNYQAVAATFDIDPSSVTVDEGVFEQHRLHMTVQDVEQAYRTSDLQDVVKIAKWLRDHMQVLLDVLEIDDATESELDAAAATFAPFALCVVNQAASQYSNAIGLLQELDVPMELLRATSLALSS